MAAAEGPATGALGPTAEAAAGEAPTAGELRSATTAAPGVEVLAGGVGPWRTRGRKE